METNQTSVCVHIRWMIRRDMPAVLGIENSCFEFAWNEDDFIRCLRQRNCIGMVAEEDEQVVGFMIYELHKNRLHIDEIHFSSIHTFSCNRYFILCLFRCWHCSEQRRLGLPS